MSLRQTDPTTIARLTRLFSAQPRELPAVAWSFLYFFSLLCGYYILRPIRDEMGIRGGVENLQWLFTATFVTMLCMVPLFGWLSARFSRGQLLSVVYGFFIVNIVLFYVLFTTGINPPAVARVFFVWLSVFNLFVVSVFWSFMNELYDNEQAKRLFGLIAAGGSAGAVAGPVMTAILAVPLGTSNLLWLSAFFLCVALFCVRQLRRRVVDLANTRGPLSSAPIGGGWLDGLKRVLRSPYLLGICLYVLLYTALATFLYFMQAGIVRDAFDDSNARTRVFALMDFATNALTIGLQLFVTGRVASRFGLSITLAAVPLFLVAGFVLMGLAPVLGTLVVVQVLRRAGNYAIARPGREMLYTVLAVDDKYKSKNFIDTVVYRGGDAVSGWVYAALAAVGMGVAGIAWLAVPVTVMWLLTGWRLGKQRDKLERRVSTSAGD